MSSALRRTRTASAIIASAGMIMGLGMTQSASAKTTTVTATEGVNIRSGPGTSFAVVGGLSRGQSVSASSMSGGWAKITFQGSPAYISADYLSTKPLPKTTTITLGPTGNKITTAHLNVRSGPGLSYDLITTLGEGTKVSLTGQQKAGFSQITLSKAKRWVSSQYLASSMTGLPTIIGTRTATADLLIRTTSGNDFLTIGEIKKGGKVSVTGAAQNGKAQIIYGNAVRWVTAQYLSNQANTQPSAPKLPKITGTRYATTELLIRSTENENFKTVAEVPTGTKLSITGVTKNGRAQIVYNNAVRWVTAQYLSTKAPAKPKPPTSPKPPTTNPPAAPKPPASAGVEKGLKPNAIKVLNASRKKFPEVRTYYGVRPDSVPDHPSGRALDIMLPNYESASGKALGDEISAWARANASSLGIEYVIWNQHIWNIRRDSEGWRYMADRGSDSANHKNHVHVTVFG